MSTVDPNSQPYLQQWRREGAELRAVLELQLTDLKVFQVGGDADGYLESDFYILGKSKCGDLAGYKAHSSWPLDDN